MNNDFDIEGTDTVCAVSTPPGRGGIAVVRISGPRAIEALSSIWKGKPLQHVQSHTAHLGQLLDGSQILDQAIATVFRAPRSYTGDDTVELSIHGSPYVQRRVIQLLTANPLSCRLAEPGEFTRRAFKSGHLDLAQAEAVADVIASTTRTSHALAIRQLRGSVSDKIRHMRESLVELASLLELELDFSEEDVEFASRPQLMELCDRIEQMLARLSSSFSTGRAIVDGIAVVIVGIPNAGKSTLLNEILDDNRAIVSDIPGTTRDIIEDTIELDGILFRFIDTAGLRTETTDEIELNGIERARQRFASTHIALFVVDSTSALDPQLEILADLISTLPQSATLIPILNKTDIQGGITIDDLSTKLQTVVENNGTSVIMETPLVHASNNPSLLTDITLKLSSVARRILDSGSETDAILTNERHFRSIEQTREALVETRNKLAEGISADLVAQHLRAAISSLSSITGDIATPEILTTIFSRFCIGK